MPKFVLNDQTKQNSYGFTVDTEGIDLSRFEENPVMLDGHWSSNTSVIGKWVNIKKENGLLTAETSFDMEDENAKRIASKVERGFIKGASMGLSFKREDMLMDSYGSLKLTRCEIFEASIVAIPSNAKALVLKMDGEILDETQIKELCLSVATENRTIKKDDYKMKLQLAQLALIALGFPPNTKELSVEEVEQAVLSLQKAKEETEAKLKLSEEKVNAFLEKEKAQKQALAAQLVEDAVKQGKITADKKATFLQLASDNYELAKSTLDAIPTKQKFSTGNSAPQGTNTIATMEDFQKLSLEEQLAFKESDPEGYKSILKKL